MNIPSFVRHTIYFFFFCFSPILRNYLSLLLDSSMVIHQGKSINKDISVMICQLLLQRLEYFVYSSQL